MEGQPKAEVTKKICKHYLEKKKRGCKFEVYKNSEFCAHHFQGEDVFMPCPLDPNHTVLKSHLEKHLLICPKVQYQKRLEQSIWYSKDINLPATSIDNVNTTIEGTPEEDEDCKKNSKHFLQELAKTQPEQYHHLIDNVRIAFNKALELYKKSLENQPNISGIDVNTLASEEYLLDMKSHIKVVDTSISDTQKHNQQCENLVQTLNNFGLLKKDVCYIEYGAGKGALSHHIALTVPECSNILIELEGRRNKMDKNHRENKVFYRIRANIKDFDVNKIPEIIHGSAQKTMPIEETKEPTPSNQEFVGVTKHMCGLASDLTFYSMLNAKKPVVPLGFSIGTCCHHRCTQELYVNQTFLNEVGITNEQKKPFFHISSWGIYRDNFEKRPQGEKEQETVAEQDPFKLDSDVKTVLGLQVKRILDIGRVLYLREKGFNCYMVKYCEKVLSPENFVIIGRQYEN